MARIEEIVASIAGRLEELHRETVALSQARAALGDGAPAAASTARRSSKRARQPAKARRQHSARQPALDGPRLEQLLAAGPSSLTALARTSPRRAAA
jgi:hypothetical protein